MMLFYIFQMRLVSAILILPLADCSTLYKRLFGTRNTKTQKGSIASVISPLRDDSPDTTTDESRAESPVFRPVAIRGRSEPIPIPGTSEVGSVEETPSDFERFMNLYYPQEKDESLSHANIENYEIESHFEGFSFDSDEEWEPNVEKRQDDEMSDLTDDGSYSDVREGHSGEEDWEKKNN